MAKKFLASLLMLTVALAIPPVALGQAGPLEPVQDWQRLPTIKPPKKILIETKDGEEIEGNFVGINGSKLTVAYGIAVRSLEQRDIQRVYVPKGSESRKKAVIGAIIGGFAGMLIGGKIGSDIDAKDTPPLQDAPTTGMAVAIYSTIGGAAAGYGIGHAIGRKRIGKVLYESK
jgi:hypothetical protein